LRSRKPFVIRVLDSLFRASRFLFKVVSTIEQLCSVYFCERICARKVFIAFQKENHVSIMVRKVLSWALSGTTLRMVAMATVWGIIAFAHPAAASASQSYGGVFQALNKNIWDFEAALKDVAAALVVVGLVASAIGWMMRSHEGLGPVFWGGITMVASGSLVLLGDNFVGAINSLGG
jgi:hypothetical protein